MEKLGIAVSLPSSLIDGRTLSPSERTFIIRRTVSGENAAFRLPRQNDGEITVSLSGGIPERQYAVIGLSSLLKESGYDFRAPSLSDIFLTVDMGVGKASIEVEGWNDAPITVIF